MKELQSPTPYDGTRAIAEDVIREDIKACMNGLCHPNLEWSQAVRLAADFLKLSAPSEKSAIPSVPAGMEFPERRDDPLTTGDLAWQRMTHAEHMKYVKKEPDFYLDKADWYVYRSVEEARDRGCIESELIPLFTEAK